MTLRYSPRKGDSPAAHVNWLELNRSPHAVHFYANEDFLVDSLSRFVGTALEAGDSSFVFATPAHLEGLAQQLKAQGVDAEEAAKKGRYRTFDAVQALAQLSVGGDLSRSAFDEFVDGVVLPLKAAAEGTPKRVAACGEIVALLWEQGKPDAAIALEHLWNELSKEGGFSFRCFYPIACFSDRGQSDLFLKLCAEHASCIPDETRWAASVVEEFHPNLAARVREFERTMAA